MKMFGVKKRKKLLKTMINEVALNGHLTFDAIGCFSGTDMSGKTLDRLVKIGKERYEKGLGPVRGN